MPLRDHFRRPATRITKWDSVNALWPGVMTMRLNQLLPPGYGSGLTTHLGTLVKVDVLGIEYDDPGAGGAGDRTDAALAWKVGAPTVLLDSGEATPPEYEVQVYDEENGHRLVAAVEIVSPRNKDRRSAREAFASKCHALVMRGVCVTIIDVVTERSHNLYADLAERIGADPPAIAAAPLYAVTCRELIVGQRRRVEVWQESLAVGAELPTLPLWFTESRYVPLELERTYEETCHGLKLR